MQMLNHPVALCIQIIALLTTAFTLIILLQSRWRHIDPVATHYTYVGEDYPTVLPLPSTEPVALVIEDPVHYAIIGPDARQEWASSSPPGIRFMHMGPEHRPFSVSMIHQLHCLRNMRAALAGDYREEMQAHFTHCLQYLRQMVLCDPNLTLEPQDVLERGYADGVKQTGAVHVCQDWQQVYDVMEQDWKEWTGVEAQAGV